MPGACLCATCASYGMANAPNATPPSGHRTAPTSKRSSKYTANSAIRRRWDRRRTNDMNSEIRTCQNCKADFAIESEDFDFYKKIKVPPPTWCPECRMVRRLTFRNDRSLYRRKCDLCRKDMVAM